MTVANFIPEIWAADVLRNLHKQFVYAALANTNYTGDIANYGDTVRINAIGPITVSDYTRNTDMTSPPTLTDAQTTLSINRAKYAGFYLDDLDQAQARGDLMSEANYEAGVAFADDLDQYIAGLYTDASATNLIGTDAAPKTDLATAGQPYVYLTQLKQMLDQSNVPSTERWVVVPPWFEAYLLQDQRFVSFGTAATFAVLQDGAVGPTTLGSGNAYMLLGRIAGFEVYRSNNVPNAAALKYKIIAGHPVAITYASQITKVEAYSPPLRFGDAVKMLHVYGARVIKPAALAVLTANPT